MKLHQTIVLLAIVIGVLALFGPAKAENFVGTHSFVIVVPSGASVSTIQTTGATAYVYIVPPKNSVSGEQTITTTFTQSFGMIFPVFENIYVVVGSSTTMPTVSVTLKDFNNVVYMFGANAMPTSKTKTITSVVTTTVITAMSSVVTKSFFVMYPAYPVSPVEVTFMESGYFMGISLGYYTVISNKTTFIPTVPVSRSIVLNWDPIRKKIQNIAVTAIITNVLPQVSTYEVLDSTMTVTNYATIIETTVGMYNDVVIITKTGQGLDTSALVLSYHYGTIAQSLVVYPVVLEDMNSFFQVASFGKEQVAWVGSGAQAVPNIIVPYTAIFLGRTYSGFMTIYYDPNGNEYVNYNATYTFSSTGSIVMLMTGTLSAVLSPGQFAGALRSAVPITTTYTTTIYKTITTQTTTTIIES